MTIDIKIAGEKDAEEWNKLVESSPHGTIFHTWKWLKIVEKHTSSKLYPLIGYKGTTPVGIFPLFYQRKAYLKMAFSPPPHTAIPYLGPALVGYDKLKQAKKETYFVELQRQVDKFINDELKANFIYISLPSGLLDPRPFKWTGYEVEHAYGYVMDLSNGVEYLWQKKYGKRLRKDVERARRRGFDIEEGGKEELEVIYGLMVDRYAEQDKMVTVPKDYLLELYDSFSETIKIFVAKYEGEIVTGVIDVYYKDRVVTWIGNPKPSIKITSSPNDLLNWETMKYACEHGFLYYETIGTAGNERLHSYFSKPNPELLVRFSAKKYSSFMFKWLANSYIQVLKPVYAKFKLMGQSK
jgi:CelD/BcsL family acetyltransferase involved in cellulose biosynthesis